MRNRFDRQLLELNDELIQMGGLIEQAIEMGMLCTDQTGCGESAASNRFDEEVDHQERDIESLCMKLLLQQQPVARDLRLISAALKDDHGYGAYQRPCGRYFRDDDPDVRIQNTKGKSDQA